MLKGVKKEENRHLNSTAHNSCLSICKTRNSSLFFFFFNEWTIVVVDLLADFFHNTQIFTVLAKCDGCISYSARQQELSEDTAVLILQAVHYPLLWLGELFFFCNAFCSLSGECSTQNHTEFVAFVKHLKLMIFPKEHFSGRCGKRIWKFIVRRNPVVPCSRYMLMPFIRCLYERSSHILPLLITEV